MCRTTNSLEDDLFRDGESYRTVEEEEIKELLEEFMIVQQLSETTDKEIANEIGN